MKQSNLFWTSGAAERNHGRREEKEEGGIREEGADVLPQLSMFVYSDF